MYEYIGYLLIIISPVVDPEVIKQLLTEMGSHVKGRPCRPTQQYKFCVSHPSVVSVFK
jgi:hypothetical protein